MELAGLMSGMMVVKFSTNVLLVFPGTAFNSIGTKQITNLERYPIDMAQVGVAGLDRGAPVNGRQYNVYLIRREEDDAFGAMISAAKFAGPLVPEGGDPENYVRYPEGWVFHKKLQFGFVWNSAWGGIPDFHISHWPMPKVRLTDAGYTTLWMPAYDVPTLGAWATLDFSKWLPDNARMVHLLAQARYVSGVAGSLFMKSYGGQAAPVLVASASPAVPSSGWAHLDIRVSSLRRLYMQTTGDVRAYVQVLGYDMTEPA